MQEPTSHSSGIQWEWNKNNKQKVIDKQVYKLFLEAKEPHGERFKEYYFKKREFDFGKHWQKEV